MLLSGPRLKFPDLNLMFTLLLSLLSPIVFVHIRNVSHEIKVYISILSLILFVSMLSVIVNYGAYYEPLIDFASLFLTACAAYTLVSMYQLYYKSNFYDVLSRDVQVSIIINCMFVMFVMFIPGVGELSAKILSQNSKMVGLADESVRAFDLVMGGGAVASIVFSVAFVFSLSQYLIKKNLLSLISMMFAIFAILFTGRTGLYLTFISIFPIIITHNYIQTGKFRLIHVINNLSKLSFLSLIFISFSFYMLYVFSPSIYNLIVTKNFEWAFEPIYNFIEKGEFSTLSTSRLMEMYSNNDLDFISLFSFFGTSMSGRDENYILRTDIGYLRVLFTTGFLGLLVIVLKYVYIFYLSLRKINLFKGLNVEIPYLLTLMYYSFLIVVVNFKEYHIIIRSGLALYIILFLVVFNSNNVSRDGFSNKN